MQAVQVRLSLNCDAILRYEGSNRCLLRLREMALHRTDVLGPAMALGFLKIISVPEYHGFNGLFLALRVFLHIIAGLYMLI